MKWTKIFLIIMSSLLGLLFYLCYLMTPAPGSISGNGNPAILFVFLMVGLFIFIVVLWLRVLRAHRVNERFVVICATVASVYIIIGFIYQRIALKQYKQVIYESILKADGQVDLHYFESITSGLSIHINNQNFNGNTFFIVMCLALLLALFFYWSGQQKSAL